MTITIFVSYKREDEDFALRLYEEILLWGHDVWIDKRNIKPGEDWDTAIHRGLKLAEVIVGILTPESVTSRNVLDEWGYALSTGKRLVLLWLRHIPDSEIPPRYHRIQRINLIRKEADGLRELKDVLDTFLENSDARRDRNTFSLLPSQRELMKQFWKIVGKNGIGKKFRFQIHGIEKHFRSEDNVFAIDISDKELMMLARLGYLRVFTGEHAIIFSEKVLEVKPESDA